MNRVSDKSQISHDQPLLLRREDGVIGMSGKGHMFGVFKAKTWPSDDTPDHVSLSPALELCGQGLGPIRAVQSLAAILSANLRWQLNNFYKNPAETIQHFPQHSARMAEQYPQWDRIPMKRPGDIQAEISQFFRETLGDLAIVQLGFPERLDVKWPRSPEDGHAVRHGGVIGVLETPLYVPGTPQIIVDKKRREIKLVTLDGSMN